MNYFIFFHDVYVEELFSFLGTSNSQKHRKIIKYIIVYTRENLCFRVYEMDRSHFRCYFTDIGHVMKYKIDVLIMNDLCTSEINYFW